jgi:hypothetical protein
MPCQIIDSDEIILSDSDGITFEDSDCTVCEEDCYLTDSDGVVLLDLSQMLMDSGCASDFSSDDFSSDFAICSDDEILNLKYWNGADWIGGRLKAWTGTQWKGTLKRYTVSGWV